MAPRDDHVALLEALAVTAELTGTQLSEGAARVMADDLSHYPVSQVLGAFSRCRRELKGRLTVAAIVERLDDGRPGPEEAWAMIPQGEAESVVWTTEMAQAFGVANPLLQLNDPVAARMAFKETYLAAVTLARSERQPVHWTVSLGHDATMRAAAVEEAVRKGRITSEHATRLLPNRQDSNVFAIEDKRTPMPEHVRQQLAGFLGKVNVTLRRKDA